MNSLTPGGAATPNPTCGTHSPITAYIDAAPPASNSDTPLAAWYRVDGEEGVLGLEQLWEFLLAQTAVRLIVEIGSADGGSAAVWKRLAPEAAVLCVDPWIEGTGYGQEIFQAFQDRMAAYPDVAYLRMHSHRAARLFQTSLQADLVYIDAVHTREAVTRDIELWRPHVRPGGILAGHDYCPGQFPGVVEAVDAAAQGRTVHTFVDTSWAIRL